MNPRPVWAEGGTGNGGEQLEPAAHGEDDDAAHAARIRRIQCRQNLFLLAGIGVFGSYLARTAATDGKFAPETRDGNPHIGYGIYLDMPTIHERMPPAVLTALEKFRAAPSKERAQELAVEVANVFAGDYEHRFLRDARAELNESHAQRIHRHFTTYRDFFGEPRLASTFMAGAPGTDGRRGVCRHKAAIVARVLAHYGVDAVTESGITTDTRIDSLGKAHTETLGHEWVVVRHDDGSESYLDPTETIPRLYKRADYLKRAKVLTVGVRDVELNKEPNVKR